MEQLTDLQFLDLLRQKNIYVYVKDQRLQISAPAGALGSDLRAELLRRKPKLLTFLAQAKNPGQSIEPRIKDVRIPLTPLQQGLWLVNHHQPDNVAYNIPEAFMVEAAIDVDIVQSAVNHLIARHEILRTSFHEQEGDLFQSVSNEVNVIVEKTDITSHPEAERMQTLQQLISDYARQPFNLRQAPLIRLHIFVISEVRSAFYLNIHHIIADRKAIDVLREELMELYEAGVKKTPVNLPALSIQYGDYAIWAENQMTSEIIDRQLKYWKRKLAGIAPFLELPHSRPYPQTRTSWGATLPIEISLTLQRSLKKIAQEEHASSFMMFMAVFAILLHRYSGAEDFCIGSPSTLRKQPELERMIGVFVNTLPFRCQISEESTFQDLVRQIRKTALEAYDNSDVPFQKLVSALKPDRKSQRSPVFQVLLGFETNTGPAGSARQVDTEPGTARYDLTLNLYETPDRVSGAIEYCTDLFDATDIRRLIEGFSFVECAASKADQQFLKLISQQ